MSSLVIKHTVHKYRLVKSGKRMIYRCFIDGCPHFIGAELIEKRASLCNRCEAVFIIGKAMICPRRVIKPHCDECARPTYNKITGRVQKGKASRFISVEGQKVELTEEFIDDLLDDILK